MHYNNGYRAIKCSSASISITLHGLGGNDILIGDTANNILIGGKGDDTLIGNGGKDTFVYTPVVVSSFAQPRKVLSILSIVIALPLNIRVAPVKLEIFQ
jgi:hypothetical protein